MREAEESVDVVRSRCVIKKKKKVLFCYSLSFYFRLKMGDMQVLKMMKGKYEPELCEKLKTQE